MLITDQSLLDNDFHQCSDVNSGDRSLLSVYSSLSAHTDVRAIRSTPRVGEKSNIEEPSRRLPYAITEIPY